MRRAFTLLEVMIAVAILTGALLVLVHAQSVSVMMTNETERVLVASMLAREKMAEIQVLVETDGFGEQDMEEEGTFEDFGTEEGLDLGLDLSEDYEDYQWAYTLRKIELNFGDMGGMTESLKEDGYWGEQSDEYGNGSDQGQQGSGLENLISSDMITEQLANYIREVRVLVWWGDNEDELDQVEIVTHVINPDMNFMGMGGSSSSTPASSSGQRTRR